MFQLYDFPAGTGRPDLRGTEALSFLKISKSNKRNREGLIKVKHLLDIVKRVLLVFVPHVSLQIQIEVVVDSPAPELSRGKTYLSAFFAYISVYRLFATECLGLVSRFESCCQTSDTTDCLSESVLCCVLRVQSYLKESRLHILVNPLFQLGTTFICMFLHSVAVISYLLLSLLH